MPNVISINLELIVGLYFHTDRYRTLSMMKVSSFERDTPICIHVNPRRDTTHFQSD